MKPCWPDHTFKNYFVFWAKHTRLVSASPLLGDQSVWNVSPVTWPPNFNRWPWFRILACVQKPPPLRKNRSGLRGRGTHRLPDFKALLDSGFPKAAKIFWIPESGLPYTGAITFISQPCLFLIWNIVVNFPKGCPPKALKDLLWAPGKV